MREGDWLIGYGCATATYPTQMGPAAARVRLTADGHVLVQIAGHLTHQVRFAGGLLGHLDRGGRFEVRQTEVAPGHWEVTTLNVDMIGRVLFFKTISVQQRECHTDFRRVPDNLSLAQAADVLREVPFPVVEGTVAGVVRQREVEGPAVISECQARILFRVGVEAAVGG